MTAWQDKRFILVVALMTLLAVGFWVGSRYPALNEKAAKGTATPLSGLSFSPLVTIASDENVVPRIVYTTVNWAYTNRQGMTFGILFGALLMTLLRLIERRHFRSRFANSVMGLLIGTPLGVCANCAAPIAQGIHTGGGRAETMLAAMTSSPTLNVIVISMVLALFPPYMAAIKIGLTVGFILLGIPLLTRLLHTRHLHAEHTSELLSPPISLSLGESWGQAVRWVVKNVGSSLGFMIKTTVPLMLLAGCLGAVAITLMPLESLADVLPSSGRRGLLLGMGSVALLGVFLPVPMTFDVLATAVLWRAGLPVNYAMVLLFTLGIFSIFPFCIVWKALGRSLATGMFFGLAGLGVLSGVLGQRYFQWDLQRQQQLVFETFHSASASLQGPKVLRAGGATRQEQPQEELVPALQHATPQTQPMILTSHNGLRIERLPLQDPKGETAPLIKPQPLFSRVEGESVGLDEPYAFSMLKFEGPFTQFRGIASGDVHNDGWIDLLLTAEAGLSLYANSQGTGFVIQRLDVPALKDFYVMHAALVDLNNDGWLDIFFSTHRHGNFVIYNTTGRFTADNLQPLPDQKDAVMTGAVAFGDVDHDGNLDIVLGHWVPPCRYWMPCADRPFNTVLLRNHQGHFRVEHPFVGAPGRQTLNVLLTHLNNDDHLDLIIGNEDRAPDMYYLGNGDGSFRQITGAAGMIPHSTATTMSVASADIDNDLLPEIYLGQINFLPGAKNHYHDVDPALCNELTQPEHRAHCQEMMRVHRHMPSQTKKRHISQCTVPELQGYHEDCIAYSLLLSARSNGLPQLCTLFPDHWETFRFLCDLAHKEASRLPGGATHTPAGESSQAIPVTLQYNVLLSPSPHGHFTDRASEMGVQFAGFTWNAKFADVDNDEFVDLYAVNGWFPSSSREPHVFYHNQHGRRFIEQTAEAGLVSLLPTSAYTYIDIDNDGDLDIVALPIVGPVPMYRNNSTKNRLTFALRDQIGNRFGIGSTIVIHYGPDDARHQRRDIQAGGGFASFDAPVAYFGLGDFQQVTRVTVHWSTGERSDIPGDFSAGGRYIIHRQAPSVTGQQAHQQQGLGKTTPAGDCAGSPCNR